MHILYIHQHFAIPAGSTGTRSYEFSRRWVKAGNKVTVITGNYDVGGLGLGKALVQRLTIEGVEIIAVGAGYSNKLSFLGRVFAFLCFMIFSVYVGLRVKGVDVIYATSTPLTVGIPAILLKWLKRVPFVFEVRDQWPEIPIEMGILKNKALIKILLWLERTIYHQSAAIVALSPGMADGVRRVLKKQRPVAVVPNSSDTDKFRPDIDGGGLRRQRGWMEKCVFLHAGAMGKANGLDFVIDAAERLRDNDTIHFVLIGEGGEKNKLKARIESVGLANIEIIDSVPKEQLPGYFAACDVSIVLFADYPIFFKCRKACAAELFGLAAGCSGVFESRVRLRALQSGRIYRKAASACVGRRTKVSNGAQRPTHSRAEIRQGQAGGKGLEYIGNCLPELYRRIIAR